MSELDVAEYKPGYVYLLRSENGLYKIGRSKQPKTRLRSLQRQFPIKIELLHCFFSRDYVYAESMMHSLHKDSHLGNEWFILSDLEVELFLKIKDGELDWVELWPYEDGYPG